MAQAGANASANERSAALSDVGAPGLLESLIPIWGSGRR